MPKLDKIYVFGIVLIATMIGFFIWQTFDSKADKLEKTVQHIIEDEFTDVTEIFTESALKMYDGDIVVDGEIQFAEDVWQGAEYLTITCSKAAITLDKDVLMGMQREELENIITFKALLELNMDNEINCAWLKILLPKHYPKQ